MTTPIQLRSSNLRKAASDVDLSAFNLEMRNKAGIKLVSAITDATIDRTIDGASTLTVTVEDDNARTIQLSGKLGRKVDVNVDGLWWTLVSVKKAGRQLTLVFEEREVNVLRYYNRFIMGDRTKITRAQFVLRMIKEAKEVNIKYVIPELTVVQKIGDASINQILVDSTGAPVTTAAPIVNAISLSSRLTVKGVPATEEQIKNANIVLQKGVEMGADRKVLVASIMTAITESTIHNYTGGDLDSVGVFQQRASQGWPATRDIPTDAAAFFQEAMKVDRDNPTLSHAMLCQTVQRSAFADGSNYAKYFDEAQQFVEQFGIPKTDLRKETATGGGTVAANNQQTGGSQIVANVQSGTFFTRGQLTQKNQSYLLTEEDSWTCMNRLANEVNWRCFCVSGIIYFVSEEWLFKSKSFMTISEDVEGIDWIDYDYDEGKKHATVTVQCHISRWSAPPGSIVTIQDMGLINGRWIVNDVSRSVFDTQATITLTKPLPVLPEPTSLSTIPSGFTGPPQPAGARSSAGDLPATEIQKRLVAYVQSQLGVPYKYGAEQAGVAFDCSGLTQAAYATVGISMPHFAQSQYEQGPKLSAVDNLLPGDLVFFGTATNIHHVGMYIGGGAMIDAPHTGAVVRVDNDFRNTWPDYYGATRPWQL